MQISCRPSRWRPHKRTLPLFGLRERRAGLDLWPYRPVGCICGLGRSLATHLSRALGEPIDAAEHPLGAAHWLVQEVRNKRAA
jgi:hypothetical protein